MDRQIDRCQAGSCIPWTFWLGYNINVRELVQTRFICLSCSIFSSSACLEERLTLLPAENCLISDLLSLAAVVMVRLTGVEVWEVEVWGADRLAGWLLLRPGLLLGKLILALFAESILEDCGMKNNTNKKSSKKQLRIRAVSVFQECLFFFWGNNKINALKHAEHKTINICKQCLLRPDSPAGEDWSVYSICPFKNP